MTSRTVDRVDELRRAQLELSEAIAPGWERRRAFVETTAAPVRAWLVRALDAQPGETILELAAGVGETGFEVAAALGAQGRLVSSDFSPAMVDAARRRAAALGVRDVEFRVLDAERIDLEPGSVDGVLCRFGYMLMPDPATALAQTRRVLRPGGRLALAVWGPPDRNPFFPLLLQALVAAGHATPPDPSAPGVFSLGDRERLAGLLATAGFADVRVDEVPVRFVFADAAEYVSIAGDTAGPLAPVIQRLSDADRTALEERLAGALTPFERGGRCELPGLALCAFGRAGEA